MTGTLVLCAAPPDDPRVEEFLRYVVGLVAAGREVELLVVGRGEGLAEEDAPLTPEAETYVEALRDAGIRARSASARSVVEALAGHEGVLCLAPRDRAGRPAVLRVDDARLARAEGNEEAFLWAMLEAGQVVRTP